ncbi:hypothetical protein B0H11DRAFT_2248430 [Mycena galericulata]|nr:hypothetical protein B0H11DRAFT_2248430 [Mycena galericulata]
MRCNDRTTCCGLQDLPLQLERPPPAPRGHPFSYRKNPSSSGDPRSVLPKSGDTPARLRNPRSTTTTPPPARQSGAPPWQFGPSSAFGATSLSTNPCGIEGKETHSPETDDEGPAAPPRNASITKFKPVDFAGSSSLEA